LINMPTQKIFGGNLTSNPAQTGIAVLGSTAGGATQYSTDLDTLQNTQFLNGIDSNAVIKQPNPSSISVWSAVTTYAKGDYAKDSITNIIYQSQQSGNLNNILTDTAFWQPFVDQFLPYQEALNAPNFVMSTNIAEIQQNGIPPYYATTKYAQYALVSNGSGQLYQSNQSNNLGNPLTNTAYWTLIGSLQNLRQATQTAQGTMALATTAEVQAGVNNTKAVTPATYFAGMNGLYAPLSSIGSLKGQLAFDVDFTVTPAMTGVTLICPGEHTGGGNYSLPSKY
jgi:hypothetical protein